MLPKRLLALTLFAALAVMRAGALRAQWVPTNGPYNHHFQNIDDLTAIGKYLIAGASHSFYRSSDYGDTWITSSPIDTIVIHLRIIGGDVFALTYAGLFRSHDTGTSWTNLGLSDKMIDDIASNDGYLFVTTWGSGVYRSSDGGSSWFPMNLGLPTDAKLRGFAIVGRNIFTDANYQGIYLSTDDGEHWIPKDGGLNNLMMSALIASGDNLFVSNFAGGVFRSTDSGNDWVDVGLDTNAIQTFLVDSSNLFCSDPFYDKVYLSTDSGHQWADETVGYDPGTAYRLLILGPYLFTNSNFSSVWRRPLSEMIGTSAVQETPQAIQGIRIYPNPLSQSTTISFTPESSGYADVSIVNLLGVEVAHLFSGELAAGEHSFEWSKPPGLPDGMYECLVRMNGRVEMLPVVLAR